MLQYKTKVKIGNACPLFDGRTGEIVGISNEFPPLWEGALPNYFYIIKLDDILYNGYDSIVLTDACIQVIEQ